MKRTGKLKLMLSISFLGCFLLIALTSMYNTDSKTANSAAADSFTIVLDAGHGGLDSGCVGINGELEKDINLAIVKNLRQLLNFSGVNVVLTRSEDISIYDDGVTGIRNQKVSDMENRKDIVNSYPNGVFMSVHQNQYVEPQYFGAQMFYMTKNKNNHRLAQIMQNNFKNLQPENNREVKLIDNNLYLFKDTKQPAVLIECGFLSNPNDAANLSDSEYQKKVAFTIYKGLLEFLKDTGNDTGSDDDGEIEDVLYMQ